jgi:hypothetical protein
MPVTTAFGVMPIIPAATFAAAIATVAPPAAGRRDYAGRQQGHQDQG